MPMYRFCMVDPHGHILRVREVECDNAEISTVAADLLDHEPPYITAVEVWDGKRRIVRSARRQ